ncbi:ABC transporter permease [Paenibacillus whitsoniae]|uniref:Putative hemin transport system permease protein HrtB n=1 Tax=Paenibacillus whitsoniae TaxID=2496558 RepID=A0A430JDB3_9BACL|nr:ABC transporter permease [Paenibacillus whitsoniae]RTE09043.1 ABC transporter permease [Paenibacillus whitsoniae]
MYLALREMRFAKARYSLIAVIMLLVAFLVLFVTGLAKGLAYDNAASIQNQAATHYVLEQGAEHRFTRSQVNASLLDQAAAIVGEEHAEPFGLAMTTVVPKGGAQKLDVTLMGVNPAGWLTPQVVSGSGITAESSGAVLVDRKLADAGVKLGTVLVDQASGLSWTVSGFVKDESFSHSAVVAMNLQDWAKLQAAKPAVSGAGGEGVRYSSIALQATHAQSDQLAAALGGKAEFISKSDAVSAISGYKEEQGSLLMMIVFLFVISAFVLAVFFYVITIQKTGQFGILKAIGTRTRYLIQSVTLQVLVLAIGSLAISCAAVLALATILPSGMPFQLTGATLTFTCLAFILMSVLGSLLSVWQVVRIDALDAIGRAAA